MGEGLTESCRDRGGKDTVLVNRDRDSTKDKGKGVKDHQYCGPFKSFKPFNRFAPFIMGIGPFQSFQSFNRFTPFQPFAGFKNMGNFHVLRISKRRNKTGECLVLDGSTLD
jgi:hypothetical protein